MSNKICTVEGCNTKSALKNGFCPKHNYRFNKYGSTGAIPEKVKGKCSVDGCLEVGEKKGLCVKHYSRNIRTGSPFLKYNKNRICIIDGCESKGKVHDMCKKHYARFLRHGDASYEKIKRHGLRHIPEYGVWLNMKNRCYNKNNDFYHRYGGRGIVLCDKWKNDFTEFYKDMGNRPTLKHQIDRTDNDGIYEPTNCKWVTASENQLNTSASIRMSEDTKKEIIDKFKTGLYTKTDLSKEYGVSRYPIYQILKEVNL